MGMESFVRGFIRSSPVWFGTGILLGLSMAWWPAETLAVRPAHAHLLGFVSMMIFGGAYHVIPRFSGAPLTSRRLAGVHLWVASAGAAGAIRAAGPDLTAVRVRGAPVAGAGTVGRVSTESQQNARE